MKTLALILTLALAGCGRETTPFVAPPLPAQPASPRCPSGETAVKALGACICVPSATECAP